MMIILI